MTIVVSYVPDQHGEAAVERGLAEAKLRQLPLVVVNAITEGRQSRTDATYDQLTDIRSRLIGQGVDARVEQPTAPDVADAILAIADDMPADLIILGIRRRTPVGKLIFGSTAQRIILQAPCAVLTV